jgi:hypothetical protein
VTRENLRHLLPYVEIARLVCFATFVALAIRCRRAPGDRRRVVQLIAFLALAALGVGVTQVEAWPFTNWALVHTLRSPQMRSWEIAARDATGRTWAVDPRVLQPLSPEEFGSWMFRELDAMNDAQRAQLTHFLLVRAERGRRAFLEGHFPPNDRILGELSAPFHFRQRRLWQSPKDVPATPFTSASIVELSWNIDARERDGGPIVSRTLVGTP